MLLSPIRRRAIEIFVHAQRDESYRNERRSDPKAREAVQPSNRGAWSYHRYEGAQLRFLRTRNAPKVIAMSVV
jgi:hypothetical protein